MRKNQFGFSLVAVLAIVLVLGLAGGVGYYVYSKNKPAKTQSSVASNSSATNTSQAATPAGTSASIDSLTQQDAQSESAIDSNYEQSEQSTAASANSAASNVGGSFSETSF